MRHVPLPTWPFIETFYRKHLRAFSGGIGGLNQGIIRAFQASSQDAINNGFSEPFSSFVNVQATICIGLRDASQRSCEVSIESWPNTRFERLRESIGDMMIALVRGERVSVGVLAGPVESSGKAANRVLGRPCRAGPGR